MSEFDEFREKLERVEDITGQLLKLAYNQADEIKRLRLQISVLIEAIKVTGNIKKLEAIAEQHSMSLLN